MITHAELKEVLHYDQCTGYFLWKIAKPKYKMFIGKIAGSKTTTGYIVIKMNNISYYAHRLAWLYMTGSNPVSCIDHINEIKDDNRFANLREATYSQNNCNRGATKVSKSGRKCVVWCAKTKKYRAFGKAAGAPLKCLGSFATIDDASAAYAEFAKIHHGEFFHE